MSRPLRAAIFDVDGTLIDSMPIWYDVGARYLRSCGVTPPEELWRRYFTMGLEEAAQDMREQFSLPQPMEEIKQGFLQIVERFYREEVPLKPGAGNFLKELHKAGVPMALATANTSELANAALTRLGVLEYFSVTLSCEDFGTTKKEPLVYRKAAERLGTEPSETAVFEDILLAVTTAHDAGFCAVAVEDRASAEEEEQIRRVADHYISNFSEIPIDAFVSPSSRS
ncbi:MAG: HAD family phosphatase [Clostridia bacterium]|nr:HAD family phosphatase [Clostridia bacterium]